MRSLPARSAGQRCLLVACRPVGPGKRPRRTGRRRWFGKHSHAGLAWETQHGRVVLALSLTRAGPVVAPARARGVPTLGWPNAISMLELAGPLGPMDGVQLYLRFLDLIDQRGLGEHVAERDQEPPFVSSDAPPPVLEQWRERRWNPTTIHRHRTPRVRYSAGDGHGGSEPARQPGAHSPAPPDPLRGGARRVRPLPSASGGRARP